MLITDPKAISTMRSLQLVPMENAVTTASTNIGYGNDISYNEMQFRERAKVLTDTRGENFWLFRFDVMADGTARLIHEKRNPDDFMENVWERELSVFHDRVDAIGSYAAKFKTGLPQGDRFAFELNIQDNTGTYFETVKTPTFWDMQVQGFRCNGNYVAFHNVLTEYGRRLAGLSENDASLIYMDDEVECIEAGFGSPNPAAAWFVGYDGTFEADYDENQRANMFYLLHGLYELYWKFPGGLSGNIEFAQ